MRQAGRLQPRHSAVGAKEAALGFVYGAFLPVHFALARGEELLPVEPLIVERAVDASRLPFQNGTLPERAENVPSLAPVYPLEKILDELHVPTVGENSLELFIGGLEQAEGGVQSAVDDLDVLHETSLQVQRTSAMGGKRTLRPFARGADPDCRALKVLNLDPQQVSQQIGAEGLVEDRHVPLMCLADEVGVEIPGDQDRLRLRQRMFPAEGINQIEAVH